MREQDKLVEQFRQRLAAWLTLRSSVAAVALWAFAWGTVVLAAKAYQGTWATAAIVGLIGLPIAIGIAVRVALNRVPNRTAVRAVLDRRGGCGGLLMAGAECDLEEWDDELPVVTIPEVRWNARRPLLLLGIAVGYAVLSMVLPGRLEAMFTDPALDISREADRVTEQVRVLKEEKVLDPERAEALIQKLEDVRTQSAGKDPAKTLEALDHVKDVVRQAAKQSAESSAQQAKELGKVQAGAEAVKQAAPELDSPQLTALMKELSAMSEKAGAESAKLSENLDAELAKALKDGKLSTEQLSKLAMAAKESRDSIQNSAQKMFDKKLIDSKELADCKCDSPDGKGLSEFLKKGSGLQKGLGEQAKKNESKDQRGSGGVSEDGPGVTPLEFGDKSSEAGAKFREEALPPADLRALKESQTSGVSTATPKKDTKGGPPTSGSLAGAAAGGGSSNSATVLPQHKAAVGRYFDRPMK